MSGKDPGSTLLQFQIGADCHEISSSIAGVRARRDPQSHKRLMLLATIALLPPAIARWMLQLGLGPPAVLAIAALFLVPMVVWDLKSRRRLHPVTLWGGLLLVRQDGVRRMPESIRAN